LIIAVIKEDFWRSAQRKQITASMQEHNCTAEAVEPTQPTARVSPMAEAGLSAETSGLLSL